MLVGLSPMKCEFLYKKKKPPNHEAIRVEVTANNRERAKSGRPLIKKIKIKCPRRWGTHCKILGCW